MSIEISLTTNALVAVLALSFTFCVVALAPRRRVDKGPDGPV